MIGDQISVLGTLLTRLPELDICGVSIQLLNITLFLVHYIVWSPCIYMMDVCTCLMATHYVDLVH